LNLHAFPRPLAALLALFSLFAAPALAQKKV